MGNRQKLGVVIGPKATEPQSLTLSKSDIWKELGVPYPSSKSDEFASK
jgi:hypothetical protein